MKTIDETFSSLAKSIETAVETGMSLSEKIPLYGSVDGQIIGTGRSDYTRDASEYNLRYNDKPFTLIDIPGIEGDESKFEEIIKNSVNKAHLVVYVNGSDKKPEPKTVEKIKKYLRNDTDVYSICNVHFPPKKSRDPELDPSYEEELGKKYKKEENELLPQTKNALKESLKDNFKDGFCINGLLAFSALAYDTKKGQTTIVPDTEDKMLRSGQQKFMHEFDGDFSAMKEQSRIDRRCRVIEEHSENFEPFIVESNKKKLLASLDRSIEILDKLEKDEREKVKNFCEIYDAMSRRIEDAEYRFKKAMKSIVRDSVERVINDELQKFYKDIEENKGKVKKEHYENFFNMEKPSIQTGITNKFNELYKESVSRFVESYEDAKKRFEIDIGDEIKNHELSRDDTNIKNADFSKIVDAFKFKGEDALKSTLSIGGLATSGAMIGAPIGGPVGIAIGAAIGGLAGIVVAVVDFFMGEEKRIRKAKEKAKEVFDTIERDISAQIEEKKSPDELSNGVSKFCQDIYSYYERQKNKLEEINEVISNLLGEIENKESYLKGLEYGKL